MADGRDKYGRAAEPEKRRAVPLGPSLATALRQLVALMRQVGIIPADVPDDDVRLELDHRPALILRDVDPVTRHHIPHQHDPASLEWLYRPPHRVKTHGSGATTRGSDVGEAKKLRNLVSARRERESAEPLDRQSVDEPARRGKPKRKWASRSFPKGRGFARPEKKKCR